MSQQTKSAHKSMQDVSLERRAQLNGGAPSSHLTETLCVDFVALMRSAVPPVDAATLSAMQAAQNEGIVRRMQVAGELLAASLGEAGFARLSAHSSDTVRGWAAYLLAVLPDMSLAQRLERIKPLADDAHYAPREWAWLALRPQMAAELEHCIALLEPWTLAPSANLRRFASESLRPRGVWCAHIKALKDKPELGLPLLEPLQADSSTYVQDSVANWLNDASKSQPDWVRSLCERWQQSSNPATLRICKRASRSLA